MKLKKNIRFQFLKLSISGGVSISESLLYPPLDTIAFFLYIHSAKVNQNIKFIDHIIVKNVFVVYAYFI